MFGKSKHVIDPHLLLDKKMGCGASLEWWGGYQGTELNEALTKHPVHGDSPVRLIDAKFIIRLSESGGRFMRRQQLPESAFMSLPRLQSMTDVVNRRLAIVVVSHPWLQPDHPDPKGENLRRLANHLAQYRSRYTNVGVFLDFMSLHQKDASGNRTEAEAALFGLGLKSLSLWYSHPFIPIFKLTSLPEGYPRGFQFPAGITPNTASYRDRGWCFFESSVGFFPKGENMHGFLLESFVADLGDAKTEDRSSAPDSRPVRIQPPLTPEDFCRQLETKSFTSKKADLPTVSSLYKAAFQHRMSTIGELRWRGLGWGDAELLAACKVLATAPLHRLYVLDLEDNEIGNAGLMALAKAMTTMDAPTLVSINVGHEPGARVDPVSERVVDAFVAAIRAGCTPELQGINLGPKHRKGTLEKALFHKDVQRALIDRGLLAGRTNLGVTRSMRLEQLNW